MKQRSLLLALVGASFVGGCTKSEPCPPGIGTSITEYRVDQWLAREVRERAGKASEHDPAVRYECSDAVSTATKKPPRTVWLTYHHANTCMAILGGSTINAYGHTLTQCLKVLAHLVTADNVAEEIGAGRTFEDLSRYAANGVECEEIDRRVRVPEETLERNGGTDWIPAVLWMVANVADKMVGAATAPAVFILRPATGSDEEACVDLPSAPKKKCADASGCPELPPGAEVPGDSTGGDVIQPGTVPITPGGDHP